MIGNFYLMFLLINLQNHQFFSVHSDMNQQYLSYVTNCVRVEVYFVTLKQILAMNSRSFNISLDLETEKKIHKTRNLICLG